MDVPESKTEEELKAGFEEDIKGKVKEEVQEEPEKVPFHQDPQVQMYIERQVAKRVGEGNKVWEDRLGKLEARLQQGKSTDLVTIGKWTPATPGEAHAAQQIIAQAKQEVLNDLTKYDSEAKAKQQAEDREFTEWLKELKVTSVLKDESAEKEFIQLIVDYEPGTRQAAVNLWKRLQEAKQGGIKHGEEEGIKKAQEAKIGSSRKVNEPGTTKRSYAERRGQEQNFSAVLDRELNRLESN